MFHRDCVGFYLLLQVIHGREEMKSDSDKVFLACCWVPLGPFALSYSQTM